MVAAMTAIVDTKALKLDWDSGLCLRSLASKYGIAATTVKAKLNIIGINTGKRTCFTEPVGNLIQSINTILSEYESRLTVRQVFYQCASRHLVPLTREGYK